ncbi:MAG: pirin family protein [Anaerolineaceae bacterium]|nr:pirin family protein [Anaerolineaceae bacterium]
MNTPRLVNQVIQPQTVIEGAGVRLRRSFAPGHDNLFDPFLLFDHFAFNDPREGPLQGFPTHPHRGIETVTYMLEGNVRHRDSLGNVGVIGPGDVQWMTSGRGILHEEMPRRSANGLVNGFQLWVNLPAAQKMGRPRYQEVNAATIPAVEDSGALVRLVAGEYQGIHGPVTDIAAHPLYMDVTLRPGAQVRLATEAGHTVIAYVFEGQGWFGIDVAGQGQSIQAVRMLTFADGDYVHVRAGDDSPVRFMLMAGSPFNEEIYPYGPFVMNTREEIIQTLNELRAGTFVDDKMIPA